MSGQRRYDIAILYRISVIQRAQQLGFTLDEIRQLFFGFGPATRVSARWRKLSMKKLSELDDLMLGIKSVSRLLKRMMRKCRCETLDQCGRGIFRSGMRNAALGRKPRSGAPYRLGNRNLIKGH